MKWTSSIMDTLNSERLDERKKKEIERQFVVQLNQERLTILSIKQTE